MMPFRRPLLTGLAVLALLLSGCSLPHIGGMGAYYSVTDPGTGKVYYTEGVKRERRGVVEFRDAASGAWVSIPGAEVRDISEAEFRLGPGN